jgi:hypothetical protein
MKRSGDDLSEMSMPACMALWGDIPNKHTGGAILTATKEQDTNEACDLICTTALHKVAIRVRGFDYLTYEITLPDDRVLTKHKEVVDWSVRACNRCSGTLTERQKLIAGHCSRYLMCLSDTFANADDANQHPCRDAKVRHGYLIDLMLVRAERILERDWKIHMNKRRGVLDGTGAIYIPFDCLQEHGCVLWASPTIKLKPFAVQKQLL